MPPKRQFTKEQIVAAAFNIATSEGIHSISTRKVAQQLGSSIAPIYVNFADVDSLKQAVVHKAFALSQQMLAEQNSGQPFLDIGIASMRFAKEYSVLFRDLIMKKNPYMQAYEPIMADVLVHMKKDPLLWGLTDEELSHVLFTMRIFTTGLSVMLANGLLPEALGEAEQMQILQRVGTDIVNATRQRE